MKIFTVEEANDILREIIPKIEAIRSHYERIGKLKEAAKAASSGSEMGGGGMPGGSAYVNSLYETGKLTNEINDLGVQIKDYSRGLIDFPAMRDGRIILLCWQLGETDSIEWWHELEGGFAGRQQL